MTILIENLTFETIIGILDFERRTPQRVEIDCTITYPYSEGSFINYAEVAQLIETTMNHHQFKLIETALDTLGITLKQTFPLIQNLSLTIRKPNILPNCTVGVEQTYLFESL
ncbi:dihydroneopterin aldolase [Sulfuricurvum sp.]|uniref:dihydroneopterin aldolase n=1 Tax=Sulfuricurvum sp. TaxID=2025608 RepID=UPI0019B578B3|nr:dihydroneopterin aldolase [Sulfuricurvum sp.]MBD3798689.1 dihydroneopterin aldolase [Campylobacterota bacterium]MBD3805901.1 dihydroneopterin aldolase [Sulfuricurvum sp.]